MRRVSPRYITTLSTIAHMSPLVTMSHTSCVTVRNLQKELMVNLYHCGIVFNCEWDLLLLHYALEIIRIVLSQVDDNSL